MKHIVLILFGSLSLSSWLLDDEQMKICEVTI